MEPDISIMTLDIIEAIRSQNYVLLNKKTNNVQVELLPKGFYGDFDGFRAYNLKGKEIKVPFNEVTAWSGISKKAI
tara:strand:+ start:1807 stop:2034 length:228 start_codon:yes stop_codon:yes gene_type:complete